MTRLEVLLLFDNPLGSGGTVEVIKALCGSGVKQLHVAVAATLGLGRQTVRLCVNC